MNWTPGSWEVDPQDHRLVLSASGIIGEAYGRNSEALANGRLIAAAPCLYEALEWIMTNRHLCNIPSPDGSWDEKAEAALRKARGEA